MIKLYTSFLRGGEIALAPSRHKVNFAAHANIICCLSIEGRFFLRIRTFCTQIS